MAGNMKVYVGRATYDSKASVYVIDVPDIGGIILEEKDLNNMDDRVKDDVHWHLEGYLKRGEQIPEPTYDGKNEPPEVKTFQVTVNLDDLVKP